MVKHLKMCIYIFYARIKMDEMDAMDAMDAVFKSPP